jgi:hypothetical protein
MGDEDDITLTQYLCEWAVASERRTALTDACSQQSGVARMLPATAAAQQAAGASQRLCCNEVERVSRRKMKNARRSLSARVSPCCVGGITMVAAINVMNGVG